MVTTRSNGAGLRAAQSTTRFVERPEAGDFDDQSEQTTLRTEIYTSEDEEEMMQYYSYLSTYKKQNLDEQKTVQKMKTMRSARSNDDAKSKSPKQAP